MAVDTRSKKEVERKDSSDSSAVPRVTSKASSVEDDQEQSEVQDSDQDSDEEQQSLPRKTSKEVEALNKLFDMFTLSDDEDYELEIGSEGEPTREDLIKLLESYEQRRTKKINAKALLVARLRTAKILLSSIQLERSIKEDAQVKLELQKDALSQTLTREIAKLDEDISSLKDALALSNGQTEDRPAPMKNTEEPNKITVKWNPSIPEHDALHRIFKEDNIPLIEDSQEVDYSKVKKKVFTGAPSLDLDMSKVPADDVITSLATKVVTFRDEFQRFYEWNLTEVLFDKLAWNYMAASLTKVNGLAKDYSDLILAIPMKDRNWTKVAACLNRALKFELLEASLADEVLKTRPKKGESVLAFAQRLKPLLEAAEFKDSGCTLLIKALGNHLSDIGFQATLKEYGSFDKVSSMKAYLKFLENTPGALDGSKTDHTQWFVKKYGAKTSTQSIERHQAHSKREPDDRPSTSYAAKRQRPEQPHRDHGPKRPRNDSEAESEVCTYSDKCKANMRRHPKEKCFFWMKDNGIPLPKRNNPKQEGKKPLKAVGAFDTIGEETHIEGINLNESASFFSSYLPSPHSDLKAAYAFKGPAPGDNRIAVPAGIMGIQCTAVLDSGATVSLISQELVNDLGIRHTKLRDEGIGMIKRGTKTDSIITCDKIKPVCNKRSVEHQFHVMDIDYYDILIGMDLFARLGFGITGVAMPEPTEEEFLWVPSDEKPPIVPLEIPQEERTPEYIKDKEEFLKAIEPLLQANANIDPKSHCTLEAMKVTLKVKPGCVIQERSRPFHSEIEREEVENTIQKWWDTGVIIPAPIRCPYNNSLTVAGRKDLDGNITKYRVCLDPRTLNRQLQDTDVFPLPLVTDVLKRASGHDFFSTIDLSQAYHRMPLDPASQPLTAFTYNGKQYMFAKAPFGLKPLTSIFQRGMSQLLGDLHFGDNFVDDLLMQSHNKPDHLAHVSTVIKRLTAVGLIINREKSNFLKTEILLLGFIVNKKGRRIDPKKLANVHSWAYPTNKKMIQRYLGLFNYFREYIPLYSTITAPLDALRNARGIILLNDLQKKSFDSVRALVALAPILSFPNFLLPFFIATDASNVGIGAVLYQLPNGDESVVCYISFQARALHKHEKNYPAYKKELLAIIFALMKFHHYVWGRKFTLYTDHRPLTYIHEQKELPQIITNWKATLLNYDFDCVYRPGLLNVIPDALSRAFPDELWKTENNLKAVARAEPRDVVESRLGFRNVEQLIPPEKISVHNAEMAEYLRESPEPEEPVADAEPEARQAPYAHVMQNEDTTRDTVLDRDERTQLLKQVHEFGHLGANAMVKAIHERSLTWPKLREDCLKWVSQCAPCQRFNIARKGYHPLKAIHAELPGEHVAIDLASFETSTRGNNFALVMVDICTRFVFLEALPNKEARTVAATLFKIFCLIGFPKIIQSDNGTEFVNAISRMMNEKLKIEHRLSTPYHPRSNGAAERFVRSLKETIRKQLDGRQDTWDDCLPLIQLQMNARVASLHNSTPFSLFFGRSFAGLTDFSSAESHLMTQDELEKRLEYLTDLVFPAVAEKSADTQRKMIDKFNRTHRILEFPPGSFVMAREELPDGKLSPKYQGPYKVMKRTSNGTYILLDKTKNELARNYAPEQLKLVTQALDAPSDESYEVESILGHRLTEGGMVYQVKWKGFDSSHNEEVPYDHFDSDLIIRQYWKRLKQQNPHFIAKRARIEEKVQKRKLRHQKVQQRQNQPSPNKGRRKRKPLPRKRGKWTKQ